MLHPAGLSFVNKLMITIKSKKLYQKIRILDLVLPDWLIVTEKYKILILVWKDKACHRSHSLEREGVGQGVQERSQAIPSKAWFTFNDCIWFHKIDITTLFLVVLSCFCHQWIVYWSAQNCSQF